MLVNDLALKKLKVCGFDDNGFEVYDPKTGDTVYVPLKKFQALVRIAVDENGIAAGPSDTVSVLLKKIK